jgi:prenylated cyclic peptide (anacyclamide/piricyclamide family)
MKTKNLTPRNTAPVKRENVATVSINANAIIAGYFPSRDAGYGYAAIPDPFAGDDAE